MPGENLTRQEAIDRAAVVATQSYDITLDFNRGPEVFGSTTTVRFTAQEGASTFIDLISRTVRSVTLNGLALDPAEVNDGVRVQLPNLAAENELTIEADAIYMNTGEGMHRFVDPVDGEVYLYSQFEVPDARRVFAVFEQPDLKAEFTFTVHAPAHWQVVSNQPSPTPEIAGEIGTWRFGATPRISGYITAVVAGPYVEFRDELVSSDGRTIPLGVFCRGSLAEHMDADYIFDITKKGFEFFESRFGVAYPFDKYDQLFCPEYNMGAMENAGCVTFTETYIFRSKVADAVKERRVVTILHELAHMWFGNLVTMKWWNDLWLNESFAEWASTLATAEATEWTEAWTTFLAMEKTWAYRQDQLPSTHPIVAEIRDLDDVQVNFDGITYAKGGSVLKQLVAWVGIEPFMRGLNAYFTKHAWGNTELRDLLVELEAASGRELTEWSKLWLETAGVNTLRPRLETDDDGTITKLVIEQSAEADYPTIRPHRMAIGFYEDGDEGFARTERFELDVDGAETEVPEVVGLKRPALLLLNDDDLAYAKVRLDDQSWANALKGLSKISSPLARALVWGTAWDATRDGEIPATEYIELVIAHIGAETESTTLRSAVNQMIQAARTYVAPEHRTEAIEIVGDALWQLAFTAEAGSDAQFQFVTGFANIASTDRHVEQLRALRSGSTKLPGLAIDTDLSWQLLDGLVMNGAAGESEIEAALAADNTANGAQSAARARALVPSVEAKLAAFDSVVNHDVPNMIVRFTGLGLTRVNDPSLLEPLVAKYFASVDRIWEERSYHMASALIEGLYPATIASAQLAETTRAWLAERERTAGLTRMLKEALATVERALVAQERDAAAER